MDVIHALPQETNVSLLGDENSTDALDDTSRYGTTSAFSSSTKPDEDWTKISDLAERRRIQNRIAQRNYRKKLKRRLEVLERRASTSQHTSSSPADLESFLEGVNPGKGHAEVQPGIQYSEDSGYASASYPRTISTAPVELARLEGKDATSNAQAAILLGVDSIASDTIDLRSLLSIASTRGATAGKAMLSLYLFEDPAFRALSERAFHDMGRNRFIVHLTRSLKLFHERLRSASKSDAELNTAMFLRSRNVRTRISRHIADLLQDETGDSAMDIEGARLDRVESWLATQERMPEHSSYSIDSDVDADEYSESEDGILPSDAETLRKGLLTGRPFQYLLRDFMLIHLPAELRAVILLIPKANVLLSCDQNSSLINTWKLQTAARTNVVWNWWPLTPPKRPLGRNEFRLSWKCTCGTWQWAEISSDQHEMALRILELPRDETQAPYPCIMKTTTRGFSSSPGNSPSSSAASAYTPGTKSSREASLRSSHSAGSLDTQPTSLSSASGSTGEDKQTQPQPQTARPVASSPPTPSLTAVTEYILFGAQGPRRTLSPDQIRVDQHTTDYTFHGDLKACYRRCRGFWRIWFSIWRLEYCQIAKFKRLSHDRMVHEQKDLPVREIYKYAPRAGTREARNPPISPHLFQAMYYVCGTECKWPQFLHDCMMMPTGSHNRDCLGRIPKRAQFFRFDQTPEIWGLEAVFAVSFAYVMVYHCILVVGPFVFWTWWLGQSPGDWQNASVPLTIVLGGLSAFWSSTGILSENKNGTA